MFWRSANLRSCCQDWRLNCCLRFLWHFISEKSVKKSRFSNFEKYNLSTYSRTLHVSGCSIRWLTPVYVTTSGWRDTPSCRRCSSKWQGSVTKSTHTLHMMRSIPLIVTDHGGHDVTQSCGPVDPHRGVCVCVCVLGLRHRDECANVRRVIVPC